MSGVCAVAESEEKRENTQANLIPFYCDRGGHKSAWVAIRDVSVLSILHWRSDKSGTMLSWRYDEFKL